MWYIFLSDFLTHNFAYNFLKYFLARAAWLISLILFPQLNILDYKMLTIFLELLSKRRLFYLKTVLLKDDSREKAEVLQKKVYIQYKQSATENVLITHKLNTPEHLKSIGKPANLIILLYEHHSIDQRIQNPTGRDYPGEYMLNLVSKKQKAFIFKNAKQYNTSL